MLLLQSGKFLVELLMNCSGGWLHVELHVYFLHVLAHGHGVAEAAAAQVTRVALALVERQVALHVQLVAVTLTKTLPADRASAIISSSVRSPAWMHQLATNGLVEALF